MICEVLLSCQETTKYNIGDGNLEYPQLILVDAAVHSKWRLLITVKSK